MIYLAGSLRNKGLVPVHLRIEEELKVPVFSDWLAAGPEADDYWKAYYMQLADPAMTKREAYSWALQQPASVHVYEFDKRNMDMCDLMVLMLPAGKSGHLELGYFLGCGKPGIIYLDQEDDPRWDVMYQFASDVAFDEDNLIDCIRAHLGSNHGSKV